MKTQQFQPNHVLFEPFRIPHTPNPGFIPVLTPESSVFRGTMRALCLKDPATYEHSLRVSEYVYAVARTLELPDFMCERMRGAALLHDIGKLCIAQPKLDTTHTLNVLERHEICSHTELGYELLCAIPGLEGYAPAVRSHHERWDGTGYPDRLVGTQITLTSRLIAVADAFDVMICGRHYALSKSFVEIVQDFALARDQQFDSSAVRAFLTTWLKEGLRGVPSLTDEAQLLALNALR